MFTTSNVNFKVNFLNINRIWEKYSRFYRYSWRLDYFPILKIVKFQDTFISLRKLKILRLDDNKLKVDIFYQIYKYQTIFFSSSSFINLWIKSGNIFFLVKISSPRTLMVFSQRRMNSKNSMCHQTDSCGLITRSSPRQVIKIFSIFISENILENIFFQNLELIDLHDNQIEQLGNYYELKVKD